MTHTLRYIRNRDDVIDEFQIKPNPNFTKKDMVKKLYTIILYGGNLMTWKREFDLNTKDFRLPDTFLSYRTEIETLVNRFVSLERYSELIEDIHIEFRSKDKHLTDRKLRFKTASILLQEEERKLIQCCMKLC